MIWTVLLGNPFKQTTLQINNIPIGDATPVNFITWQLLCYTDVLATRVTKGGFEPLLCGHRLCLQYAYMSLLSDGFKLYFKIFISKLSEIDFWYILFFIYFSVYQFIHICVYLQLKCKYINKTMLSSSNNDIHTIYNRHYHLKIYKNK